jgi:hypothetical protein
MNFGIPEPHFRLGNYWSDARIGETGGPWSPVVAILDFCDALRGSHHHFATFASAVSTFRGINLSDATERLLPKKVASKKNSDDLSSPQICCGTSRTHPLPKTDRSRIKMEVAEFPDPRFHIWHPSAHWHPPAHALVAASLLTGSMITSTPGMAARFGGDLGQFRTLAGDVISDQVSRRPLQPLGHGRIPLGGCAIGHRDCGWTATGACHLWLDHLRTFVFAL